MPEYYLICPNIFGHFVSKLGEIQTFYGERKDGLILVIRLKLSK